MKTEKEEIKEDSQEKVTFNINKENNFSEWYSEIIDKAELLDIRYNVKGFVVFRPWATLIIEKMYDFYEFVLQKTGHLPVIFPSVIPEENFKKEAEHVKGFSPNVFWLKGEETERLALRPTSETAFYQLYNLWIRSWKDLPLKLYQRANIFRFETEATRPLIRSREFLWIETHDVFRSREEALKQIQEDIEITEKVMHQIFCVPFLPLKRPSWDKFAGAEFSIASDCILPDGKLIQQPSTHMINQSFTKSFNIKYKDEKGNEIIPWQTCYGPATSRILASIIANGDNSGLILPFSLAPIQVIIIPIYTKKTKDKVMEYAKKLEKKLKKSDVRVEIDKTEKRPGEKFYYWEMKGVPFRLEIGEKELKSKKVVLFNRQNLKKSSLSLGKLKTLEKLGKEFDKRLREKAEKFLKSRIINCKNKEQIKKVLDEKKVARANFCSLSKEGEKCAEYVEKELLASVRGERVDIKEKPTGNCVFCNKKANYVVYIGKSY